MSLLDFNLENVKELATVPEGEYQVRVVACEMKQSQKTGGNYLNVRLELADEPDSKNITHILMLPADGDDDKRRNSRLRAVKGFYEAFEVDYTKPVESDDLQGLTGWAIVVEENSDEYGTQNRVRRFVQGK